MSSRLRSSGLKQLRVCSYFGSKCKDHLPIDCTFPWSALIQDTLGSTSYILGAILFEEGLIGEDFESSRTVSEYSYADDAYDEKHDTDPNLEALEGKLTHSLMQIEDVPIVQGFYQFGKDSELSSPASTLHNLSRTVLARIGVLNIQLSYASGHGTQSWPICEEVWDIYESKFTVPQPVSSVVNLPFIEDWLRIARYIFPRINPLAVELNFMCDVTDYKTAELVVQPLLETAKFPRRNIRLGWSPDPRLQALARRVALSRRDEIMQSWPHPYKEEIWLGQTRPAPWNGPFRFQDLPAEIRLSILEYTDLVTPLCEVEWSKGEGYKIRFAELVFPGEGSNNPRLEWAAQFNSCEDELGRHFACSHSYAAYSAQCCCWCAPKAHFLVSRSFREDAMATFYSKNRFILTPTVRQRNRDPGRLPQISFFLEHAIPAEAKRHIRFLEIVFPTTTVPIMRSYHREYRECFVALSQLAKPGLGLRIYFPGYVFMGERHERYRILNADEREKLMASFFEKIIRPLKGRSTDLARLFIHFSAPFPRHQQIAAHRNGSRTRLWSNELSRTMGSRLEKFVMGKTYESAQLLKYRKEMSQWLAVTSGFEYKEI